MTRVSHHPEVIWDVIEDEVTICHTGTGAFYRLNESAAVIWRALGTATPGTAVDSLVEAYPELTRPDAERVVEGFVRSMEDAGLVARPSGEA